MQTAEWCAVGTYFVAMTELTEKKHFATGLSKIPWNIFSPLCTLVQLQIIVVWWKALWPDSDGPVGVEPRV